MERQNRPWLVATVIGGGILLFVIKEIFKDAVFGYINTELAEMLGITEAKMIAAVTEWGIPAVLAIAASWLLFWAGRKWDRGKTATTVSSPTMASGASLSLLVYGRKRPPKVLKRENIYHYKVIELQRLSIEDKKLQILGTLIFITFDKMIDPQSVEVGSDDMELPAHTVDFFTGRSLLISFSKYLSAGTLNIDIIGRNNGVVNGAR